MLSTLRVASTLARPSLAPAVQVVPAALQRPCQSRTVQRSRQLQSSPRQLIHSATRSLSPSLATHPSQSDASSLPAAYPAVSFQYRPGLLTSAELAQYHRDGFIVKRQFYSPEEMRYLLTIAKSDRELGSAAIDVPDAGGRKSKLTVWNYLGEGVPEDIYAAIGRGQRMAGVMQQILGDEPYHYHSKMMLKEPKVGGAWEWHQDYGYWVSLHTHTHTRAPAVSAAALRSV